MSRKIDTLLSSGLFLLPIPGAPRGLVYPGAAQHPTGTRLWPAEWSSRGGTLGVPVLTNTDIATASLVRLASSPTRRRGALPRGAAAVAVCSG